MADLTTAPLRLPDASDHVRGSLDAPLVVIEYGDFECIPCGLAHLRLRRLTDALGERVCFVFRHFAMTRKHPRAEAAHRAAEAAALQGRFWEMHDSLYAGQAWLEQPDLWRRATELGLDLDRFEADRRSEPVAERVRADFREGIRVGANATPTVFIAGERFGLPTGEQIEALIAGAGMPR